MEERMLAPDLPAFFAKDSRRLDFSFFFLFFFLATKSQVGGRQREKLVANGDQATGNFEHCFCCAAQQRGATLSFKQVTLRSVSESGHKILCAVCTG